MTRLEAQGDIYSIDETRSYGQSGFTKREFIIKLTGEGQNPSYPNYIPFEFIRDKCALLDAFQVGDAVKVSFNLNGRLWAPPGKPEKCFVNLQAWRIEKLGASSSLDQDPWGDAGIDMNQVPPSDDDFPF